MLNTNMYKGNNTRLEFNPFNHTKRVKKRKLQRKARKLQRKLKKK